jgi:hypothetical protein
MQRSIEQLKHKLRQLKKLEIKIRFGGQAVPPGRKLVKYHPDRGGDASRFIEMMEIYERLTGNS